MNTFPMVPAPARSLDDAVFTGDPAALIRLRRWGGEALVHDLVQLFQGVTPGRLHAARTAVAQGDAPAAEAAAHALGSSAGQLGALHMRRLCMHIEALAAAGSVDGAAPLVREVEEEYARFLTWIARETTDAERVA